MKSRNSTLCFLVLLNVLNMVDRNLLSAFAPQISADLNLSDTQFGLLTGLLFVTFYSVMGLFMGSLADRFNRPRLMALGIAVWSLLTAYTGTARNFLQVAVARMMIGVGESTLTPAAMSMLSDIFPPAKRGFASGIYYLGVPLGAGASYIVASALGPQIGWRNCFFVLGGIGVVLALILLFFRDPPRGAQDEPATDSEELEVTRLRDSLSLMLSAMREQPALVFTMLGAVFFHIPLGSGQFAILWLVRERGFTEAEITGIYGLLFIVIGTLGSILGGLLSDWYNAHYKGGRARFLAFMLLAIAPLIVAYRWSAPDSPLFWLGMGSGFLMLVVFYGPTFSTVQDLSPPKLRGVMTAFLLLSCNLLGLGFGAVLTGILSDSLSANGVTNPLTWSLITADVLSMLAMPCFFMASIYIERMKGETKLT